MAKKKFDGCKNESNIISSVHMRVKEDAFIKYNFQVNP